MGRDPWLEILGLFMGLVGIGLPFFETALLLCCLFEGLQDGRDGLGIWGSGRVLLGLGGRGVWSVRRWDGPGDVVGFRCDGRHVGRDLDGKRV